MISFYPKKYCSLSMYFKISLTALVIWLINMHFVSDCCYYGNFVLQPLLRELVEQKQSLTQEEAKEALIRCLKILFYRDARSFNKVSIQILFNRKMFCFIENQSLIIL